MTFLSANELAQMRAEQSRTLLGETCTILQATSASNAIGERVLTWGTVGTAVPCRLSKTMMASYGRTVAGQDTTLAPWVLTLPYGTVVNAGDRVVIDGVTYEIRQSWDEATFATATRCDVIRLEV